MRVWKTVYPSLAPSAGSASTLVERFCRCVRSGVHRVITSCATYRGFVLAVLAMVLPTLGSIVDNVGVFGFFPSALLPFSPTKLVTLARRFYDLPVTPTDCSFAGKSFGSILHQRDCIVLNYRLQEWDFSSGLSLSVTRSIWGKLV